jgi:WD40 repeat protein
MIWDWNFANNNVSCKWVLKGHERGVEALKSDPTSSMLATGSWDGQLKIWSASPGVDKRDVKILEAEAADVEPSVDKVKTRVRIKYIWAMLIHVLWRICVYL